MKKLDGTFLVNLFNKIKEQNPNSSLDELLYAAFNEVKESEKDSFEDFRNQILSANKIDEYAFSTKGVNPELKRYIESKVFPEYSKNDQGHGIVHIREVIRRSFALKSTLKFIGINLLMGIGTAIAIFQNVELSIKKIHIKGNVRLGWETEAGHTARARRYRQGDLG